ncbi:SURF1 family protein [Pengzhenrongella frigida]|uniref:SURF1-like protein n=2 Tax=Pengzhenrongella frigida TaxID=1259133 RepID=A0A4Q5N2A9_9MICO|nr:SURF1 family protein [Cellulomonas sp. HLT2-17]
MLVALVLLLGAAAVCVRLGAWQLDRAAVRGDANDAVTSQEAAAPAPIGDVLAPQQSFRGALVGRRVEVTGTYEPAGQLLVVDRVHDGRLGYLVLTPLRVDGADGGAGWAGADPVLPVVRGWVADPAAAGDLLDVPGGVVQLTGYLQASEAPGSGGSLAGQIDAISSAELVNSWGGPIYAGYLVLADARPAQPSGLATLDPPTLAGTEGGRWNLQNLSYALQWWIFGGFALFLWLRLVKDEALGEPAHEPDDEPDAEPDGDVTHQHRDDSAAR